MVECTFLQYFFQISPSRLSLTIASHYLVIATRSPGTYILLNLYLGES